MFLFYVLSFFKKGDTIQGGTLFKEIRYMKAKLVFIGMKQKILKKQKKIKGTFFSSPDQYPIFHFGTIIKKALTPPIGIEVAQQIKFSGCLRKGHFSGENAFLALKLLSGGQADNCYSLFLPKG